MSTETPLSDAEIASITKTLKTWLRMGEHVDPKKVARLLATIRADRERIQGLRDALSRLARVGLAIRSAGPWSKRDAWPEFFDAVDEADALSDRPCPIAPPFRDRSEVLNPAVPVAPKSPQ